MMPLPTMTIAEMIDLYNLQNPTEQIRSWKRSKVVLIDKFRKDRSIAEAVKELLWHTKPSGEGLRYDEILAHLRVEFPHSRTSLKGLRWYSTTLQKKNPDVRMPERPRRPRKKGVLK